MAEESDDRLIPQAAIESGFRSSARDIGKFNLGFFGITGVGKSTLLNAVFGEELAETGIGEPVTQDSRLYRTGTSLLGIFDTKGLEVGSDNREILRELRKFVETNRLGHLDDQIHVVWYCFRAGDRRIQPAEVVFIQQVAELGIPVLVVMTQTPLTSTGKIHADALSLAVELTAADLPIRGDVHFVNATGDEFAGFGPFGLAELLDATADVAPEGVRSALAAAQRVSRRQKRIQASSLIDSAERELAGKVFLPSIGETWAGLFAGIATVYGLPEEDALEVLERARSATRLRRMLQVTGGGILVVLAAPVPGVGWAVSASILAARAALTGGLLANKLAKRIRDAGHEGVPVAWDESDDEIPTTEKQRIGSGFAAGQVTRAIGESWLETCDAYWARVFPDPPDQVDAAEMAQSFADELFERLPRHLKAWEERTRRLAAEANSKKAD